ncbi:MAG: peptidoglycan D,D-transpeptidase FtsI family protein [Bacilli bacterium]|jgi:cell division protein FtsI/penicillin-binding protein 2
MKRKLYYQKRDLNLITYYRYNIITGVVVFVFLILLIKLVILQIGNIEAYQEQLLNLTVKEVTGSSVPRGRIYDRNYNLLVDNIGYKVIYYQKPRGITLKEEIELAYKVGKIIELDYEKILPDDLKRFWLILNPLLGEKKITENENRLLERRELKKSDLEQLKIKRVTDDDLKGFKEIDKIAAYLYTLMNKGYYFDEKVIKNKDVSDQEWALIAENTHIYPGFSSKLEWKRNYLYGDLLREVLGNVSTKEQGIPLEYKNDYLTKGYALNDRVGLSFLEFQYEDLLKGEKTLYKVNRLNQLEIIEKGKRGHDLVLTIDIKLQQAVEEIIAEELRKAKDEYNTDYYNKAIVLISDPLTGEILTYASKQIVPSGDDYKIYDYTPFISLTPIVAGSAIKGASMAVAYKTGVIDIGTKMLDECIKLKHTPKKCSWRDGLGVLDDILALQLSSNSYQFKIAMKVGGAKYVYNGSLNIDLKAFDTYREMFGQFGLGVETGIDLPSESLGYKGKSTVPGHLLDFAIGQYDTYTPLQLLQYINTIANGGERYKLNLLKEVYEPTTNLERGNLLYKVSPTLLNKVDLEEKYIKRIQEGFRAVMSKGLGVNQMGNVLNPAGKTGTSESFLDTTGDGVIDTDTITKTFVGYFPYENPKMSLVVISPDVSHYGSSSSYISAVNTRITRRVSEMFSKLYEEALKNDF